MGSHDTDKSFAGSIPKLYETFLVPLIFEEGPALCQPLEGFTG